jgi:hypothetical protein
MLQENQITTMSQTWFFLEILFTRFTRKTHINQCITKFTEKLHMWVTTLTAAVSLKDATLGSGAGRVFDQGEKYIE